MKKYQLKNLIRESIKELMTEQGTQMVHQYRGYLSSTHGPTTNPGHTPCQASGLARLAFGTGPAYGNQVAIPGAVGWTTPNHKYLNNINTYQWFGSPSVGQFVGIQATANYSVTGQAGDIICWEYLGMVSDNNSFQTNNIFNNGLVSTGVFSDCTSCDGNVQPVSGCTDSNAYNHDPNATLDDGSCDYGFYCKDTMPGKPGLFKKCSPANQSNPGPFATIQDCLDSGCEPKRADKDDKTIKEPTAVAPVAFDAQSDIEKTGSEDEYDTVKRMQELANIKR